MLNKILVCLLLMSAGTAYSAGFRENRTWQFEEPLKKSVRIQSAHLRMLEKGGYYRGSHAARYSSTSVGQVSIDEATIGHISSSTNIANFSQNVITGDANSINADQTLQGSQDASNRTLRGTLNVNN